MEPLRTDISHTSLPDDWETLNEEQLEIVLKDLPVQELMKHESSPNNKLKRKATQTLSQNLETYLEDKNLDDLFKTALLSKHPKRSPDNLPAIFTNAAAIGDAQTVNFV